MDADGNSMRRWAEADVFCPVAPCWTATVQRIASMTLRNSTRAVAGYSLCGRVLSGLSIDHFAGEGPETFDTATDRAASVAPLAALSSAQ